MADHPNLEMLRRGMAAFAARDRDALDELFDENLVWHHGGTSELAGDYFGTEEVFTLFARRAALTDETYRVVVESAVANDVFITVLSRAHARIGARSYDDALCSVYRVIDGKLIEAWTLPAHPDVEERFYSGK